VVRTHHEMAVPEQPPPLRSNKVEPQDVSSSRNRRWPEPAPRAGVRTAPFGKFGAAAQQYCSRLTSVPPPNRPFNSLANTVLSNNADTGKIWSRKCCAPS